MKQLDLDIHTGRDAYSIGRFGINYHKHDWTQDHHPKLYCDQFGDVSHLSPEFYLENAANAKTMRKQTAKRLRKCATHVSSALAPDSESEPPPLESESDGETHL